MLKQSGERDDVDLRAAAETCEDPQLRGTQTLASRPRSQYLTLRVRGHPSLMIGVRESFGRKVKRVNCWTDDMGSHRTHSVSCETMIAKITLDHSVGFLQNEHSVMLVHMHWKLADESMGQEKLAHWWDLVAERIRSNEVRILMGEWDKSLFQVVPALRMRQICIDACAWFPWRESSSGAPGASSLGIFAIDCPGEFVTHDDIEDAAALCHTKLRRGAHGKLYATFAQTGAPGYLMKDYLPVGDEDMDRRVLVTLEPSDESKYLTDDANAAMVRHKWQSKRVQVHRTADRWIH